MFTSLQSFKAHACFYHLCAFASGCMDKKRVCDPWAPLGFLWEEAELHEEKLPAALWPVLRWDTENILLQHLLQRWLPVQKPFSSTQYCSWCIVHYLKYSDIIDEHSWLFNMLVCSSEPLDAVSTPTPPPENVKIKIVPRGKVVGFRCGTKNTRVPPKSGRADLTLWSLMYYIWYKHF